MIYSKKIRSALNNGYSFLNGNSGKVGLIIDAANAEDLKGKRNLQELYKLMGIKKESLRIVVCEASVENLKDMDVDILNKKDVSVSGNFKSETIQAFSQKNFDFLICHFSKKCNVGSLLAAVTSASVKIGNAPDEYGIYNVEVQTSEIGVFQQEVLKYIEIFKRNN
ncbi:hypothetical protein [Gramella sp. MAR_2010_147]|uniref:DUF6913 domain-containing protein n=1 Tax=Gramella sp. MAR_2010_147 TaxID=1250205 RepID=UPI0012FE1A46|nr:hypothetical protein [Gramella sp. MAR_2010_147]